MLLLLPSLTTDDAACLGGVKSVQCRRSAGLSKAVRIIVRALLLKNTGSAYAQHAVIFMLVPSFYATPKKGIPFEMTDAACPFVKHPLNSTADQQHATPNTRKLTTVTGCR